MPSHLYLVHNLYNERQDRTRSVTADETANGYDAWHVGDGRRKLGDSWKPTTANAVHWVRVDAGAAVACDTLAIDRGHNLAGRTVSLQTSADLAFSSPTTVFTVTFPSSAAGNTSIDAANGAYTEEGAWIKRFTEASARYWRVHVAAASSYVPEIVGLWLGKAWAPPFALQKPAEDGVYQIGPSDISESARGWWSGGAPWRRAEGRDELRLSEAEEANARTLYLEITKRRPFWRVFDTAKAERSILVALPPQSARSAFESSWHPHTLSFNWREWDPIEI